MMHLPKPHAAAGPLRVTATGQEACSAYDVSVSTLGVPFPRMMRACGRQSSAVFGSPSPASESTARRCATVRAASPEIKVWMFKTEVLETMLYSERGVVSQRGPLQQQQQAAHPMPPLPAALYLLSPKTKNDSHRVLSYEDVRTTTTVRAREWGRRFQDGAPSPQGVSGAWRTDSRFCTRRSVWCQDSLRMGQSGRRERRKTG